MPIYSTLRALGLVATCATITMLGIASVLGQSLEQARENCRETVGKPIARPCIQSGGDPESCRAKAKASVQACIKRIMNAARRRANVPVAIPKELTTTEPADAPHVGPPAAFVAPPRTISDITAILDSEKPDISQIEQLKAKADAKPTGGSREALAWFYFQRGNVRAGLGRSDDSIADANKAIEVARGGVDPNLLGRLQQFAGLQYAAAGNLRQALAIFTKQTRDNNVDGAKGYLFEAYKNISAILVQMGDLAEAEAFLRRSTALIVEARTSGLPGWRQKYAERGQSWESGVEANRAIILEARGKFREAETAWRNRELRRRAFAKVLRGLAYPPSESETPRRWRSAAPGARPASTRQPSRSPRGAHPRAAAASSVSAVHR